MSENNLKKAIYGFAESSDGGKKLADALHMPFLLIELHRFPDGESQIRLPAFADKAILYRPLDHPNDKLIEIILAADEMRQQGANHLTLVAPYLPYMRQDIAFRPGEAISQRIIGTLLGRYFNRIITVDPHLHRTPELGMVFAGRDAVALTAAGLLGDYLAATRKDHDFILVGPDEESTPLVKTAAEAAGVQWIVASKTRHGDKDVVIELPETSALKGHRAVIIDDVISSGATILACAEKLRAHGATSIDVCTTHALFGPDVTAAFKNAGIGDVISCDGVPHPTNKVSLAPLLASVLTKEHDHER